MYEFNKFLRIAISMKKKFWLRSVTVPGYTDSEEYILKLKEFASKIPNVEKIELLPYHLFGVNKYEKIGIDNKLKDIPPMDVNRLEDLYKLLK